MFNQLITAFGAVCLTYVWAVAGVAFRTAGEDPRGAGMIMMGLHLAPFKSPQYFFLATLFMIVFNYYISPVFLIWGSFIFAFLYPRKFVDLIFALDEDRIGEDRIDEDRIGEETASDASTE
jgi:hypothetical protein